MKEFEIALIEGGVQLRVIIVTKTIKEAAAQLGISVYYLKTYGYCYKPKTEIAIKNNYQRFAYFDSGPLKDVKPEWFKKVMPLKTLADFISEYNKRKYKAFNSQKQ